MKMTLIDQSDCFLLVLQMDVIMNVHVHCTLTCIYMYDMYVHVHVCTV